MPCGENDLIRQQQDMYIYVDKTDVHTAKNSVNEEIYSLPIIDKSTFCSLFFIRSIHHGRIEYHLRNLTEPQHEIVSSPSFIQVVDFLCQGFHSSELNVMRKIDRFVSDHENVFSFVARTLQTELDAMHSRAAFWNCCKYIHIKKTSTNSEIFLSPHWRCSNARKVMPPSPFSQWWILWVFRSEEPTKLIIIEKFQLHSDELQSNRMLINFSVLTFLSDALTHRLWLSTSPECAPCSQRTPSELDQMRTIVNRRLRLSDKRIPSAMDPPTVPRDSS